MSGSSPADIFCLQLCGFGSEGCETAKFERSRFGPWCSVTTASRKYPGMYVINADEGGEGTHGPTVAEAPEKRMVCSYFVRVAEVPTSSTRTIAQHTLRFE